MTKFKNVLQRDQEIFSVPTNKDPASILGMMDFDFDKFHFWDPLDQELADEAEEILANLFRGPSRCWQISSHPAPTPKDVVLLMHSLLDWLRRHSAATKSG